MQIYYYEGEDRRGPVNPAQLKTLAASGRVTPETIVEVGDKRLPARKVKGLEFPAAAPPPVPASPEPAPLPEMLPASGTESPFARELKAAGSALEKSVKNIIQIGWAIICVWFLVFAVCVIAAVSKENAFPIILGGLLSAIPAVIAASVFFFLGNLGRFLLAWTRYRNGQ